MFVKRSENVSVSRELGFSHLMAEVKRSTKPLLRIQLSALHITVAAIMVICALYVTAAAIHVIWVRVLLYTADPFDYFWSMGSLKEPRYSWTVMVAVFGLSAAVWRLLHNLQYDRYQGYLCRWVSFRHCEYVEIGRQVSEGVALRRYLQRGLKEQRASFQQQSAARMLDVMISGYRRSHKSTDPQALKQYQIAGKAFTAAQMAKFDHVQRQVDVIVGRFTEIEFCAVQTSSSTTLLGEEMKQAIYDDLMQLKAQVDAIHLLNAQVLESEAFRRLAGCSSIAPPIEGFQAIGACSALLSQQTVAA